MPRQPGALVTRDLPSLDAPAPGATCPRCLELVELVGMCGACGWDAEREQAWRAQVAEAKRRARTWQLGRAVNQ